MGSLRTISWFAYVVLRIWRANLNLVRDWRRSHVNVHRWTGSFELSPYGFNSSKSVDFDSVLVKGLTKWSKGFFYPICTGRTANNTLHWHDSK